MTLEVLSLNVNQFGRYENQDYILSKVNDTNRYLEIFFNENTNGVVILHEVLYERKNYSKTKAYTYFCTYWRDKGYSIKETNELGGEKRQYATFRTLAITKNEEVKCKTNDFSVDSTGMLWARWVELKYRDYAILGVHIPQGEFETYSKQIKPVLFWDSIIIDSIKNLQNNNKVIVIGDLNTNIDVDSTNTQRMEILKKLCIKDKRIIDAWEQCVDDEKSFTVNNESKEELCRSVDKDTFVAKSRIDYALCSNDIDFKKMIVDDRTRDFTDHSAIKIVVKK